MSEREEFEVIVKKLELGCAMDDGDYVRADVRDMWTVYKACAELKYKRIAELEAERASALADAKFNQAKFEGAVQANTQVRAERDALKAKFAELEKQEPIGTVEESGVILNNHHYVQVLTKKEVSIFTKFYAAPVIPDTAFQKALLEARIDERNIPFTEGWYAKDERLKELRAQLAALGE